jgi:hypothetical protein
MEMPTFPLFLGLFVPISFTPHLKIILEAQVMTELRYGENWYPPIPVAARSKA